MTSPYSAPYPQQPSFALKPGGLTRRFLARLIDGILVNIVAVLLAFFAFDRDYWFLTTGVFSGVLMFGYFVLFESTNGATFGKRLLGLRVRGPGGAANPDVRQSAIRNAFTLLAVIPYLGDLLAFVAYVVIAVTISGSSTRQGKHDEWAGGTQVVKD